jgi:hypothetical protein
VDSPAENPPPPEELATPGVTNTTSPDLSCPHFRSYRYSTWGSQHETALFEQKECPLPNHKGQVLAWRECLAKPGDSESIPYL